MGDVEVYLIKRDLLLAFSLLIAEKTTKKLLSFSLVLYQCKCGFLLVVEGVSRERVAVALFDNVFLFSGQCHEL